MIVYVLLVLALASFVIAFFSARTWHWSYVLVVEALFLASLGFFLLATETVRINAVYRSEINRTQKQLDTVEAQNNALQDGTNDGAIIGQLSGGETPVKTSKDKQGSEEIESLADLNHELLIATRRRGRVWRNAKRTAPPNAQTGAVTVALPAPTPAGMKAPTVVYVFEEGAPQSPAPNGTPRGPQYLGEFSVTQAGPQQATLQPTLPLDRFQLQRLATSHTPWVIYETMPMDQHDIFAGISEQQLKQLLPKQSVNEYLRDAKPATANDDPTRVVGYDADNKRLPSGVLSKATKKIYERRLHDYALEFDQLSHRRIAMLTDIDAVKKDIARLTEAQTSAKQLQAYREDERKKLNTDLAGITKEKQAIANHLAQVNKLLARARELTADLLRRNEQLAQTLAARQLANAHVP
ncbi:MAG TPA: hypothetical protein VHE81_22705 [Lacipirellulaceae bacterium]|nr:hypothetical protein [Lacipirellulaceae bacterium]